MDFQFLILAEKRLHDNMSIVTLTDGKFDGNIEFWVKQIKPETGLQWRNDKHSLTLAD